MIKTSENYQNSVSSLPLQLSFLVFSMLLNCMGIIILKFSSEKVAYSGLGILEAFKDLPIALTSLLAVNFIGRYGQKKALMAAMLLVAICCIALPLTGGLWFFRVWLVLVGISFAVAKMSVFGLIRSNSDTPSNLARMMSRVEAGFMVGIFTVNLGFGWLLSSAWADYWRYGFWLIAVAAFFTYILIKRSPYKVSFNEEKLDIRQFARVFKGHTVPFFITIFLIVFVEQGFNSWLPTFYKNNLGADSFFALQSAALLALFSFSGRWITGRWIGRFSWHKYVVSCLVALGILLILIQVLMLSSPQNPLPLWLFPVIGLFLAPLYPLINSRFLHNLESSETNRTVSVIMIFSSLGSSVGSLCCSMLFQFGFSRFYALYSLVPVCLILLLIIIFIKYISSNRENT